MDKLITYLIDNLIIDIQGELNLDMVREFLDGDDSQPARTLYAKLVADGGVEEMMVVLADCLREYIRTGINDKVVFDQLQMYVDA